MKRLFYILSLSVGIICFTNACAATASQPAEKEETVTEVIDKEGDSSDMEAESVNRTIIAEALGIDEESRNIRFLLSSLNTIGAGQIQKAEKGNENGEDVLLVVAEDNTNYCIYLTGSGKVDAVRNMDTGDWVITSQR